MDDVKNTQEYQDLIRKERGIYRNINLINTSSLDTKGRINLVTQEFQALLDDGKDELGDLIKPELAEGEEEVTQDIEISSQIFYRLDTNYDDYLNGDIPKGDNEILLGAPNPIGALIRFNSEIFRLARNRTRVNQAINASRRDISKFIGVDTLKLQYQGPKDPVTNIEGSPRFRSTDNIANVMVMLIVNSFSQV